ncbi:MAG: hypothetical protein ABI977_11540 [Acidobacteriota bacterium]
MGRIFEPHEIINTREAKGMRTLPSSRGVNVNFSEIRAKRESQLQTPHPTPNGREVNVADFIRLKSKALSTPGAALAPELSQIDPQKEGEAASLDSARLVADFAGLDDANWTPPDSQIAAGPDHLLAAVNATFAVFDKKGRQLLRRTLADLFSRLVEDALIFNPKLIYDQFRGVWLIAACARSFDAQRSWFLLASSQSGNPLGDWWLWALDAGSDSLSETSHWPEGLGLAVDNSQLYLTANMFTTSGEFAYAKLRVLNIKEMQSGGVLHGWDFWQLRNSDGSLAFGLQPALNLRAAGAQYLLNATPDGQGLTQWTITQPMRQAPALARRFIPTAQYHLAPDARQVTGKIEVGIGDSRLVNVVFRHGLLWTAHTVAANWDDVANTAAIHWLQVNPRAGCITQQGFYGAPREHYFCPAVMVDGEGNMLLVFNRVNEHEPPSLRFTGRQAADESGLLQASELLLLSSASASCDWSNFNGAAVAPDDSEVWLIGQYVATASDWPTWIGAVTFSEPDDGANVPYSNQSIYA